MREAGKQMMFIPDRIEVRKGEQIRFVLNNEGISTTNSCWRHAPKIASTQSS